VDGLRLALPENKRGTEFSSDFLVSDTMNQDKRLLRKLKRDLKRAGNKRRRQFLKRTLEENPEEAAHAEFDFGRTCTTGFNGMDRDATRRKIDREER
jgi:hypothetical protein